MKKITLASRILQKIRVRRELVKLNNKKIRKSLLASKFKDRTRSRISQAKLEHLESYLKISCQKMKVKKRQDEWELTIPEDFSLYRQPEKVLSIINEIAQLKKYPQIRTIFINHINCIKHDLAAEILLASSVNSLKSFKTRKGARFRVKGIFPTDPKMCRLMRSIGIVHELGNIKYQVQQKDKLRLFKRESQLTEKTDIFGKDKKTRATEDFTVHLNSCLSFINGKLDEDESKKLDKYLGEVLGNAEEHSGKKLWHIVGYLDGTTEDEIYSEIIIFNVGKTIFETFEEKKDVSIVYDELKHYISLHGKNFTDEQLTMVYSLQQNVSSKKDEEIDRGQGSKYLIDLFHHLSDECNRIKEIQQIEHDNGDPTMLILSGGTMLKFDGKYLPEIKDEQKMVYAFNETNDLDKAPDYCYTPRLEKVAFPGTAIYIKFPLNQKGDTNE